MAVLTGGFPREALAGEVATFHSVAELFTRYEETPSHPSPGDAILPGASPRALLCAKVFQLDQNEEWLPRRLEHPRRGSPFFRLHGGTS